MSKITRWLDEKLYSEYPSHWDDEIFRKRILDQLKPGFNVLDLGAGAGIVEQMNFRGRVAKMCGVDLDPRVIDNPLLDEGKLANAGKIPYGDATFDVVFSANVLEHLEHPLDVFREVNRVLKPGGIYLFKTPNKWHYVPMIAKFTPHRFHELVNRLRGRAEVDTFPTLYRANSKRALNGIAKRAGMEIIEIKVIEARPEYLRMTAPTYLVGWVYEKIVNSLPVFEPFRVLLIGAARKPSRKPAPGSNTG